MQPIQWSEALTLDLPLMDHTHQEFVDLLARVQTAADDALCPSWSELLEHTEAHFGREDQWMQATGFSVANCHSTNHQVVLNAMREGLAAGQAGQLQLLRDLANELAAWFPWHAQSMDAGLALHMRSVGFDPETGLAINLPAATISGCGSTSCSDKPAPAAA